MVNLGFTKPDWNKVLIAAAALMWADTCKQERGKLIMFGKIKEGTIQIENSHMHYAAFGKGSRPLVIIPGLSDGLRTIKGTGLLLWFLYRSFAKEYRVWVFSRKNELEPGMTTREMARDQAAAMDKLEIKGAQMMGISQGGMISQWLAIDYREKVDRLVLVVTLSRQNETIQKVVRGWIALAEQELYGDLAVDTMEQAYSEKALRKWQPFYWLVRRTGKPVSKERYLIQANSCITHNAHAELKKIICPTLIIGGGEDKIIGGAGVQQEMADNITDNQLVLYPDLGHDAYTAGDFNGRVLDFLQ